MHSLNLKIREMCCAGFRFSGELLVLEILMFVHCRLLSRVYPVIFNLILPQIKTLYPVVLMLLMKLYYFAYEHPFVL